MGTTSGPATGPATGPTTARAGERGRRGRGHERLDDDLVRDVDLVNDERAVVHRDVGEIGQVRIHEERRAAVRVACETVVVRLLRVGVALDEVDEVDAVQADGGP